MSTAKVLADRFREVILNGRWVATTNLLEQIVSLNVEQANKKIGDHNSILALCFHLNYYIAGVNNLFKGGQLDIRDKYSFDFEEKTTNAQWQRLIEELKENATFFANHVESLSEAQLQEVFVEEQYGTYQRNIDGMIEHCYYHFGQVVLLKKLILTDQA